MDRKIVLAAAGAAGVLLVLIVVILLNSKSSNPDVPQETAQTRPTASDIAPEAAEAAGNGPDIKIDLMPSDTPAPAAGPIGGISGEVVTLAAQPMLYIDGEVNVTAGSTTIALQNAYNKIRGYMAAKNLSAAGPPLAITLRFDQASNVWTYRAGIPLAAAPASPPKPSEGIGLRSTYSGAAARFVHIGDPSHAQPTYGKIAEWMRDNGLVPGQPTWEEYTSDPQTPVSNWRTNIYIPIG